MDSVNSVHVVKAYKPVEIPEHLIAEFIKQSNAGNKNSTKLLEKLANGGEPTEKISPEALRLLGIFFASDNSSLSLSKMIAKKLLQLARNNGSENAQQDIDNMGLDDCDSSLDYDETPF